MPNTTRTNAILVVFIICSMGSAVAQPLPREKPVAGPPVEILAPPVRFFVHLLGR